MLSQAEIAKIRAEIEVLIQKLIESWIKEQKKKLAPGVWSN
jgi:hypothetical protein